MCVYAQGGKKSNHIKFSIITNYTHIHTLLLKYTFQNKTFLINKVLIEKREDALDTLFPALSRDVGR